MSRASQGGLRALGDTATGVQLIAQPWSLCRMAQPLWAPGGTHTQDLHRPATRSAMHGTPRPRLCHGPDTHKFLHPNAQCHLRTFLNALLLPPSPLSGTARQSQRWHAWKG